MKEGKTSPAFKTNTLILKTESGATCGLYSGVPATKTYEAIIHTANAIQPTDVSTAFGLPIYLIVEKVNQKKS